MNGDLQEIVKANKKLGYIACIRDLIDLGLISGKTSTELLDKLANRF